MKLFRRDQRKAPPQIETHLVPEDGNRPNASAVVFARAVVDRMFHQIKILLHFRSPPFIYLRLPTVIWHMPYGICHMDCHMDWLTGSEWLGTVLTARERPCDILGSVSAVIPH